MATDTGSSIMHATEPIVRVRVNITKTSRAYNCDTTAEVSLPADSPEEVRKYLRRLLQLADEEARAEIARRKELDAQEG